MSAGHRSGDLLSAAETRRYGRHLVLSEVGLEGQVRLKATSVLLVGAGGLGSPAALYLAAAGIGRLGIVDFDVVEETNLQRQILFGNSDLGRPKVDAARRRLRDLNPLIDVEPFGERLDPGNAERLVREFDLVIDGSDNFTTRYLVNDACVLLGKPNVHGSIFRFEGQVSVFSADRGPCYRCLFPQPPPPGLVPSCAEGGVLGVLPGIIGSLQATEVLKLALRIGTPLVGRMLLVDALGAEFRELELARDPDCPACGERPTITSLSESAVACDRPAAEAGGERLEALPAEVAQWLEEGGEITLLDVRTPLEVGICRLPGSTFIPLQELPERLDQLDRRRRVVVYCHHGIRSAQAVAFLRGRGFAGAVNLTGGIEAWAREVDTAMARY
jgi:adenylyltransferase/sulfurtransferase